MSRSPRVRLRLFLVVGLLVTLGIAFAVSPFASSQPDGLNRVAIDKGFDDAGKDHALAEGPTAGYALSGVDDHRLATGAAGVIGVVATFVVGGGAFWLLRRSRLHGEAGATEVSPRNP